MEDPEILSYRLNFYKPLLDKAIKLTDEYVSKHKLILTGGMAIDLALRIKGKAIYDDDQLPDYDIISDENVNHAHALAKILCDAGLPNVNVINAVHITTVRVRMKRDVLLDATYVPPTCFKKIPYLDVDHLRVVHPHYQFIDQRLSLSQLTADTGASLNVFNRLFKDINRNLLLRSEYPIDAVSTKCKYRSVSIPLDLIKMDSSKLKQVDDVIVYTGKACLAGFVGYALMLREYDPALIDITVSADALTLNVPIDVPIRLLSIDMASAKANMKNPIMHRPLINLKPVAVVEGDFEIVDTFGMRIGCNVIEIAKDVSICVASTDYLLMELLRDRIYVSEEPFSSMYSKLCNIVDEMREKDSDPKWWPSLNCYGKYILPEYRVFMLEKLMDSTVANLLKPRNEYLQLRKCTTRGSAFDRNSSHYFLIDGTADPALKHTNYQYIVDEFIEYIKKERP
jgi:Poly(A) polymerase catalytic subunit